MAAAGTIFWTELNTRDPEAARAFYAGLLGWDFDESPDGMGGTYLTAMRGDSPVAGIYDMRPDPALDGAPAHWFTYVAVDDLDAAVATTLRTGGTLRRPAFDVPGVGRFAVIVDPSGGGLGLVQPAPEG